MSLVWNQPARPVFSLITWNRVYLQGLLTGRRREPFSKGFCTLFTRKFSLAELCCHVDFWQARSSQAISTRWGGTKGFLLFVEAKAVFAVHILHWTFYWMPQNNLNGHQHYRQPQNPCYLAYNAMNEITVGLKKKKSNFAHNWPPLVFGLSAV